MTVQHIPPPLMTSEPWSFARRTIVDRKPQIIRQVMEDNEYPPEIVAALEGFRDEIAYGDVAPLHEEAADVAAWNAAQTVCAGRTWLELPWYFAETYFYRRLLEAVRYLQPGDWLGHDPFAPSKLVQINVAIQHLERVFGEIEAVAPGARLEMLLHAALWGNRADLSNFTVREGARAGLEAIDEAGNILLDDTARATALLRDGVEEVAFVNDNVGADSLFDLVLSDFLLQQGRAAQVTFYVKDRPFFVSDAMAADIDETITHLTGSAYEAARALSKRLRQARNDGRLALRTDPFWTSWRSFWQMPDAIRDELVRADLVILKGDVNYRRLLDDRHWPHTTPLEEIVAGASFPCPLLVLRTLKGEILAGLEPGQAEAIAAADPTWLINGKRGLVHLIT
jgi:hypothetical protein